jgi:hypothetical protein
MTLIVTSEFELNQVASPNLPLAPNEYSRAYTDQLNNVLRLYFNRLDAILGQLEATETLSEETVINGGSPSQAYDSVTDNAELTPSGFFNGGTP